MPTSSEITSLQRFFFFHVWEAWLLKGKKTRYISLFTFRAIPLWPVTVKKKKGDINYWKWSFGKRGGPKFETALNVLSFESLLYVELWAVDWSLRENCNWSCYWKINTRAQHIQPRDNGINTECSVSMMPNAPYRLACKVNHPCSTGWNLSDTTGMPNCRRVCLLDIL